MHSGAAVVLALACLSVTGTAAHAKTLTCTGASNVAVWWVPATNTYYRKGQAGYGKGTGQLVCRSTAAAHHARAATSAKAMPMTMPMSGSMHKTTTAPAAPAPAAPMPMMSTGPNANPTATPAMEPTPPPASGMPMPMPAPTHT